MVRITLMINKKLARLKTIKQHEPFDINSQKPKGTKERFEMNLRNRFEKKMRER